MKDYESAKRRPIQNNLDAMQRAFEDAGIRFLYDDDGRGTGISADS